MNFENQKSHNFNAINDSVSRADDDPRSDDAQPKSDSFELVYSEPKHQVKENQFD